MATKNILLIGDSLVDYLASIGPFTTAREAYDYDRAHPGSGYFDLRTTGENSWAPKFADAWTSVTPGDVPKFINGGVSGTKLIGNWDAAGATRTATEGYYTDAGSPALDDVLMIIGANDVMSGLTVTTATYVTAIQSVKAWISAAPFTGSPQLYLAIVSQASSVSFSGGDANVDFIARLNRVRQAVLDAETAGHCAIGVNLTGQVYTPDNVHPDDTTDANEIGYGMYLAVSGGTPAPRLTSATIAAAKNVVTVHLDRALSNSGAVGGFSVYDSGVAVTGLTATVQTTTRVSMTWTSGGGSIAGTPTISFAHVRDAIGVTVPKGVAQSVNGDTYAAPVVPFFAVEPSPEGLRRVSAVFGGGRHF